MTWRDDAACAGEAINTFYPPENSRGRNRESYLRVARGFCGVCDVRLWCLHSALEKGERFGVFGGGDFEKLDLTTRQLLYRWVRHELGLDGASRSNGRKT